MLNYLNKRRMIKMNLLKKLVLWVVSIVKSYTILTICMVIAVIAGRFPELVTSDENMQVAIQRKIITVGLVWLSLKIIDDGYARSFNTDKVLGENAIAVAIFFGLLALAIALA